MGLISRELKGAYEAYVEHVRKTSGKTLPLYEELSQEEKSNWAEAAMPHILRHAINVVSLMRSIVNSKNVH